MLKEIAPVVVAFSGGVDSSYLAYKANQALGMKAVAVTGESASVPSRQRIMASQVINRYDISRKIIYTKELDREDYCANSFDRCYFCKDELFAKLAAVAAEHGATIVDGLNADDTGDFRPGKMAARDHNVRSPLMEIGLTKDEIRELSRRAGLPTADIPASACLSSRFPYGVRITQEKLEIVDRGEEALSALGFRIFRVRHHDNLVRLEFGSDDLKRALNPEIASRLATLFRDLGYKYVTLDLVGYRSGSGNEVLSEDIKQRFNPDYS